MSAERLRQAADRLDALAGAATPGPWVTSPEEFQWGTEVIWYDPAEVDAPDYVGTGVASGAPTPEGTCTDADGAYIATMHPGVGKALAVWLRDFANWQEGALEVGGRGFADDHPVFAVADAILGGAS